MLGDSSKSLEPSDVPQVHHIYDQPGSYIVSMTATNPVTGSITVSQVRKIRSRETEGSIFKVIPVNRACAESLVKLYLLVVYVTGT